MGNEAQTRIRLVRAFGRAVGNRDSCSAINARATSAPGDLERPFSMSQTPCGVIPIASPISESVILQASERSSVISDAHLVMGPRLRFIGIEGQGPIVTSIRNDPATMDKHAPGKEVLLGKRVDYWIKARGFDYRWFAGQTGYSYSGLLDLLAGKKEQNTSTRIAKMALVLGVNAYYLETGEGDPLKLIQEYRPPATDWPFDFDPILVYDLNQNERELLGAKILKSIHEIRAGRTKAKQRRKEVNEENEP